ncbi:MAG: hypothetical protein RIR00_1123, partial [Pseudomonadota bacterium]
AAALEESLPWLTETLAQGDGAQFRIETSAPPAAAKPAG